MGEGRVSRFSTVRHFHPRHTSSLATTEVSSPFVRKRTRSRWNAQSSKPFSFLWKKKKKKKRDLEARHPSVDRIRTIRYSTIREIYVDDAGDSFSNDGRRREREERMDSFHEIRVGWNRVKGWVDRWRNKRSNEVRNGFDGEDPRIRQRNFVDWQRNNDGISSVDRGDVPSCCLCKRNGLKGNLFAIRINDSNRNFQY